MATQRRQAKRWLPAALLLIAGCSNNTGLFGPYKTTADESARQVNADTDCRTAAAAEEDAQQLLRLINLERFDIGPVDMDPELADIAAQYACRMIDGEFFDHVDPATDAGLADRMEAAGYAYRKVGENLAAGITHLPEIVEAWTQSPAHDMILHDASFTRAGVAVRYGGEYGVYCVLILADPGA